MPSSYLLVDTWLLHPRRSAQGLHQVYRGSVQAGHGKTPKNGRIKLLSNTDMTGVAMKDKATRAGHRGLGSTLLQGRALLTGD